MRKVVLSLIIANICAYGLMAILNAAGVTFKHMHFILLNVSFGCMLWYVNGGR